MTADSPELPADPLQQVMERQLVELLGARYRLGKMLGRGGMGAVYRATDTMLDREVAIKVIPPELARNPEIVTRFEREARTAAKLDHPGIIPIYSVERGQDISLFIMKFVKGRDLDGVMAADPHLSIEFCRRVIWEAACALGHAHHRGVIHRDIKPANILLDESDRVLITDFGIAKAAEGLTQLTSTGMVLGTPQYMSPEQAMGEAVSGASDQYSLGMTGYHLLAGRPAFPMSSIHALIYKHVNEAPPPLREIRPDIPVAIAEAIARALAKNPAERFPTMEAFASAIWPERPVAASGTSSTVVSASAARRPARRPALRWLMAAGLVIVLGIGGFLLQARGTDPETPARPAQENAVAAESTAVVAPPPAPVPQASSRDEPAVSRPRPVSTRGAAPASAPAQSVPPAMGFLTVQADPFGTVYIDGAEIQDTPLVRYQVAPGRHIVEIRRAGYRTVVDTLDVASGANPRISKTLLPQ